MSSNHHKSRHGKLPWLSSTHRSAKMIHLNEEALDGATVLQTAELMG